MDKISKPNGKSQALLREGVEFQSAMQKAGLAELTQITLGRDFYRYDLASKNLPKSRGADCG